MSFGYDVLGFGSFPNRSSLVPLEATGGTKTTSGLFTIHTFTSSGTFAVQSGTRDADYLVIAGGGGGFRAGAAGDTKGGGGAGGYRNTVSGEYSGRNSAAESQLPIEAGNYTVTIGAGGANSPDSSVAATKGADTVFGSITSLGGGASGNGIGFDPIQNGGSGAGGRGDNSANINGGSGTAGQGFDGGNSVAGTNQQGGGGGGAGGAGAVGSDSSNGIGGVGLSSNITGSAVTRAVGGNRHGDPAANTGGGGIGSGASGVVIIRYLT